MKQFILASIITGAISSYASMAFAATYVDVRFLVDEELISKFRDKDDIRDELDSWIAETNTVYSNSEVSFTLRNIEVSFRNISNDGTITDSEDFFDNAEDEKQGFEKIERRAKEIGADYTVAVLENIKKLCGQAARVSQNSNHVKAKDFDDSVVLSQYSCGSSTFSHELGHLMGLAHGDTVADARDNKAHKNGLNSYSKGWGVLKKIHSRDDERNNETLDTGEYGTIMVGNNIMYWTGTTGAGVKVPLFSNPGIKDSRCGVNSKGSALACGNSKNGDASRTLHANRFNYASHQTIDVHFVDYLSSELHGCIQSQYPHNSSNDNTDIDKISNIYCPTKKIRSVHGIQDVTGLVKRSNSRLDLRNNFIVGLGPLQRMHKSAVIDLRGNNVADCHQLKKLKKSHINTKAPSKCLNVAALNAVF